MRPLNAARFPASCPHVTAGGLCFCGRRYALLKDDEYLKLASFAVQVRKKTQGQSSNALPLAPVHLNADLWNSTRARCREDSVVSFQLGCLINI